MANSVNPIDKGLEAVQNGMRDFIEEIANSISPPPKSLHEREVEALEKIASKK